MCAIIGCYLESPTPLQIQTLERLFIESQVRGKHATGYSMIRNGRIFTQKAPIPAETFVQSYFAEVQPGDYTLQLIGHCRYSTSDLRYNQPIHNLDAFSIVHNGVIDQRPSVYWKDWGYELQTRNDSELIWHSAFQGREPLIEFPEASMAVGELHVDKGLRFYRNGKRPAWVVPQDNGFFVCSTADIAVRSGLKGAKRMKPGVVYTSTGNTKLGNVEELIP